MIKVPPYNAGCPCSAIVHPHILIPRSLLRTPRALCIMADLANGGNLFRMVRRGGPAGLPAAAAAFLFQQLTVAAHFGQGHDMWLHLLSPSKLLIAWNEKGMPVVKVNAIGYNWPRGRGDSVVDAQPTTRHEACTLVDSGPIQVRRQPYILTAQAATSQIQFTTC